MFSLFRSDWFTRLWPVQEVVVAKQAVCFRGDHTLPWADVAEMSELMKKLNIHDRTGNVAASGPDNGVLRARTIKLIQEDNSRSLVSLLRLGSVFETSDPRDKIYAILGLVQNSGNGRRGTAIQPNYAKAVKDVYIEATIVAMEDSATLEPLRFAQYANPRLRYNLRAERLEDTREVPSWVPRYELESDAAKGTPSILPWTMPGAEGGLKSAFKIAPNMPGVLRIQGVIVGDVIGRNPILPKLTSNPCNNEMDFETFAARFNRLWIPDAGPWSIKGVREMTCTYALGRRMSDRSRKADERTVADFGAFLLRCKQYHRGPADESLEKCLAENGAYHGDADVYATGVYEHCYNRTFITTADDRSGMAAPFTYVEDVICIVFGCQVPLILRRRGAFWQGKRGEFWQLIGNAYVCGIMDVSFIFLDEIVLAKTLMEDRANVLISSARKVGWR